MDQHSLLQQHLQFLRRLAGPSRARTAAGDFEVFSTHPSVHIYQRVPTIKAAVELVHKLAPEHPDVMLNVWTPEQKHAYQAIFRADEGRLDVLIGSQWSPKELPRAAEIIRYRGATYYKEGPNMPKPPKKIKVNGQVYELASVKKEAAHYKPVDTAPPETKYQFLISLGPKQYVFFFDGDRRFLGWAPSMAQGLNIPEDAEVAETNYQLALIPGQWTK